MLKWTDQNGPIEPKLNLTAYYVQYNYSTNILTKGYGFKNDELFGDYSGGR